MISLLFAVSGKKSIPEVKWKETITFSGMVSKIQNKEGKYSLYLNHLQFPEREYQVLQSYGCIVYTSSVPSLSVGDVVLVSGKPSAFESVTNPGQFQIKQYYENEKIAFCVYKGEIEGVYTKKYSVRSWLYKRKQQVSLRLEQLAGDDSGVLKAVVLGEKKAVEEETTDLFQKSGISHVLVISGLHFSLLGGMLFVLLKKVAGSYQTAGLISITVLFLYGTAIGFSISSLRAFLMFAVLILSKMLGKTYHLPSSLAVAVLVLEFKNPNVLFQGSFQLSVGAVLSVILLYPALLHSFSFSGKQKGWRKKLWEGFILSLSVQLGLLPCLLYYFYEISPYSVLMNMIVIPCLPLLLFGTCAALSVSCLGLVPGKLIIKIPLLIVNMYEKVCLSFQKLPKSVWVLGKPNILQIVLYYALLLVFLWMLNHKKQKVLFHFLMIGTLWFVITFRSDIGMTIAMLDVGQGQSICVYGEKNVFLYDGGSSDVGDVGKYRIVPFLKSQGIAKVDAVIISHSDMDHCNGIVELLNEPGISVGSICFSKAEKKDAGDYYKEIVKSAKNKQIPICYLEKNDTVNAGKMMLKVLYGPEEVTENRNEQSLVVKVKYKDFSALFTGDIGKEGEEKLLQENEEQQITLLQVPHHGSATSCSRELLEFFDPEMAWISCGKNNRYGHPHKEVLERIRKAGAEVFRTDERGAVILKVLGDKVKIRH